VQSRPPGMQPPQTPLSFSLSFSVLVSDAGAARQAVAALGGASGGGRNDAIFLAAALQLDALARLEAACAAGPGGPLGLLATAAVAVWAPARREVIGRRRLSLGGLTLQARATRRSRSPGWRLTRRTARSCPALPHHAGAW